jgi:hypothetical protein
VIRPSLLPCGETDCPVSKPVATQANVIKATALHECTSVLFIMYKEKCIHTLGPSLSESIQLHQYLFLPKWQNSLKVVISPSNHGWSKFVHLHQQHVWFTVNSLINKKAFFLHISRKVSPLPSEHKWSRYVLTYSVGKAVCTKVNCPNSKVAKGEKTLM